MALLQLPHDLRKAPSEADDAVERRGGRRGGRDGPDALANDQRSAGHRPSDASERADEVRSLLRRGTDVEPVGEPATSELPDQAAAGAAAVEQRYQHAADVVGRVAGEWRQALVRDASVMEEA